MAIVILSWVALSCLLCLALLKAATRRIPASQESIIHRNIAKAKIDSLIATQLPAKRQKSDPALEAPYTVH
jgi:hypothetical protein